jgi:hypothetical protein
MLVYRRFPPAEQPETTWIIESQAVSAIYHDIHVIVFVRFIIFSANSQRARHTQVDHQPAGFEDDQQVLCPPLYISYPLPTGLLHVICHRPAQIRITHPYIADGAAKQDRGNSPESGFNFGQFGHLEPVNKYDALLGSKNKKPAMAAGLMNNNPEALFDLRFLVHNVFAHDGIVLFQFNFFRRIFLVFIGCVKVTGAC